MGKKTRVWDLGLRIEGVFFKPAFGGGWAELL